MRLTRTRLVIVGSIVAVAVAVVAAVVEWWPVAVAALAILQAATIVVGVTRKGANAELTRVKRSLQRVERKLSTMSARALAIDENTRADISESLYELTLVARSLRPATASEHIPAAEAPADTAPAGETPVDVVPADAVPADPSPAVGRGQA